MSIHKILDLDLTRTFGNEVRDISGKDHHGRIQGGADLIADPLFGRVLSFDGNNDKIEVSNHSDFELSGDMSATVWAYFSEKADGYKCLIGKGVSASRNFGLWCHPVHNIWHFQQYKGGNKLTEAKVTQEVEVNKWYHIAGVREGNVFRLYLDGVEVASTTNSHGPPDVNGHPIHLGHFPEHSYHKGKIAKARLFNRALNATEIWHDRQAAFGPMVHWPLDEVEQLPSNAYRMKDRSGNEFNGVVNGFSDHLSLVPDERFGSCMQFDGNISGYIKLPNFTHFPGQSITTSCWVNPTRGNGVLSYASTNSLNNAWLLYGLDALRLFVNNEEKPSGVAFPNNAWHHLAVTWQNSDGRLIVYKNGVGVYSTIIKQGQTIAHGGSLIIGQEQDTVGGSFDANQSYIGKMAHVRVYNYVLDAEAIQRDIAADLSASAAFQLTHPLQFQLLDENDNSNLYILKDVDGQKGKLLVKNESHHRVVMEGADASVAPDAENYHLELRFRPGTLAVDSLTKLSVTDATWKLGFRKENGQLQYNADGSISCFLLSQQTRYLIPGQQIAIDLQNIGADASGGGRGTNVLFGYKIKYSEEQPINSGSYVTLPDAHIGRREQHLSILNHDGKERIPLHVSFIGSNRILKDGSNTDTKLRLRITYPVRDQETQADFQLKRSRPGMDDGSTFFLSYDVEPDGATGNQKKDWALGKTSDFSGPPLVKVFKDNGTEDPRWEITSVGTGISPSHKVKLTEDISLSPGGHIEISFSNFHTSLEDGLANLYLQYQNIPGYWDGTFVCVVERAPLVFDGGKVGIGTNNPQIQLALGDTDTGFQQQGDGELAIYTNNAERVRIDRNGKVGIGTNNPQIQLALGDTDTGFQQQGDGELAIYTNNAERVRIDKNGKVGIGTNNPQIQLALGDTDTGFQQQGDGELAIYTNNAERVRIDKNGKIGIGTSSSLAKLTISGVKDAADGLNVSNYHLMLAHPQNENGKEIGIGFNISSEQGETAEPGAAITHERTGSKSYGKLHFKTKTNQNELGGLKTHLTINEAGKVGIGTTSPNIQLALGDTDTGFQQEGDGELAIYTNNVERIRIDKNGKMGIGINNPSAKLHIINTASDANGYPLVLGPTNGSNLRLGYHNDYSWIQSHGLKPLRINPLGNHVVIGSGTTDPQARLTVSGFKNISLPAYAYLKMDGGDNIGWVRAGDDSASMSIWAETAIRATAFVAPSDVRIKDIIGLSNNQEDLEVLKKIEVKDYQYLDRIAHGNKNNKKVIGQQIAEVFPQAVSSNVRDVIPDIMKQAKLTHGGWLELPEVEINKGEKVRLIFTDSEELFEVLEVNQAGFRVESEYLGNVFVYGREVHDFHVVDYQALSMLHLSATQALIQEIDGQKKQLNQFENKLHKLERILMNGKNSPSEAGKNEKHP